MEQRAHSHFFPHWCCVIHSLPYFFLNGYVSRERRAFKFNQLGYILTAPRKSIIQSSALCGANRARKRCKNCSFNTSILLTRSNRAELKNILSAGAKNQNVRKRSLKVKRWEKCWINAISNHRSLLLLDLQHKNAVSVMMFNHQQLVLNHSHHDSDDDICPLQDKSGISLSCKTSLMSEKFYLCEWVSEPENHRCALTSSDA